MESGLTLNGDMMMVLTVLVFTVGLFVFEVVRVDVVAICIMVMLGLLGLVPAAELFNGFASNAVISIIAVMILGAGLDPENVTASSLCTKCRPDLFHSYRRDGEQSGRMFSVVGLAP